MSHPIPKMIYRYCIVCAAALTNPNGSRKTCSAECRHERHLQRVRDWYQRHPRGSTVRYCVVCATPLPKGGRKNCSLECKLKSDRQRRQIWNKLHQDDVCVQDRRRKNAKAYRQRHSEQMLERGRKESHRTAVAVKAARILGPGHAPALRKGAPRQTDGTFTKQGRTKKDRKITQRDSTRRRRALYYAIKELNLI